MSPVPLSSAAEQERRALKLCLGVAKKRLDEYRADGNEIMEATTEADINRMLDELKALDEGGAP